MRNRIKKPSTPEILEDKKDQLVALTMPVSPASDRYRMLFAKVDRLCRPEEKKIIALTSSIKGEGKTTTASNLSVVCARDFGKRCLVIDGDFKNPALAKRFGVTDNPGLSEVISEKCRLGNAIQRGPVENLTILPMGNRSLIENNVWTSDKMKEILKELRGWFDYIWVDAPPILPIFDMSLISDRVDGVLIVIRSGEVPEELLTQAMKSLGSTKVIGSILNGADLTWPSQYYQYGY